MPGEFSHCLFKAVCTDKVIVYPLFDQVFFEQPAYGGLQPKVVEYGRPEVPYNEIDAYKHLFDLLLQLTYPVRGEGVFRVGQRGYVDRHAEGCEELTDLVMQFPCDPFSFFLLLLYYLV